ncbi:MAG: hypothetical protein HQL23_08500, partial [Candidatus Omnitrophica bacterium]|nr:hypothetical protein [Candidatus Omnitrophota bacterium]
MTNPQLYVKANNTFQPNSSTAITITTGSLYIPANSILYGNANTFNVTGNWYCAGTFTPGTSSVVFSGAALQTAVTNTQNFYNLTINNTATDANRKVIVTDRLNVSNAINIAGGSLDLATNNVNATIGGDFTIQNGGGLIKAATGTMLFNGNTT